MVALAWGYSTLVSLAVVEGDERWMSLVKGQRYCETGFTRRSLSVSHLQSLLYPRPPRRKLDRPDIHTSLVHWQLLPPQLDQLPTEAE